MTEERIHCSGKTPAEVLILAIKKIKSEDESRKKTFTTGAEYFWNETMKLTPIKPKLFGVVGVESRKKVGPNGRWGGRLRFDCDKNGNCHINVECDGNNRTKFAFYLDEKYTEEDLKKYLKKDFHVDQLIFDLQGGKHMK
jgi:hypothetical protein